MDTPFLYTDKEVEHSFDAIFKKIEKRFLATDRKNNAVPLRRRNTNKLTDKRTGIRENRKLKPSKQKPCLPGRLLSSIQNSVKSNIHIVHDLHQKQARNRAVIDKIFRKQSHRLHKEWMADLVKSKRQAQRIQKECMDMSLLQYSNPSKNINVTKLQDQFRKSQNHMENLYRARLADMYKALKRPTKIREI